MTGDNLVMHAAVGNNVNPLSIPRKIETNISQLANRVKVILPLTGVAIPVQNRVAFLNSLRVFIEHTDETTEFVQGTVVYETGQPAGIEIELDKFSTFQIVSLKTKIIISIGGDVGGIQVTEPDINTDKNMIDLYINDIIREDTAILIENTTEQANIIVDNEAIALELTNEKVESILTVPIVTSLTNVVCEINGDLLKILNN